MDEKRKEQFYQNIVYDVWKDTLQDNTFDIDDNNRKQQWNIDDAFRIYSTTHG